MDDDLDEDGDDGTYLRLPQQIHMRRPSEPNPVNNPRKLKPLWSDNYPEENKFQMRLQSKHQL